jgi:hypothetical protein
VEEVEAGGGRLEGIGWRRNQIMEVTCAQRLPTKCSNFEAKLLRQYNNYKSDESAWKVEEQ